ncbi:hypothetical protein GmHk_11G033046 [Glycine max]|nr:hypothetical protein GmHk_11G033046 [Glycine max]
MLCCSHDSLEEQTMQGSFVLHGRRARVVGISVTISQYFGQASRDPNTSSASITQQQLAEIIGNLKEEWRKKVKEENKNLQEAWRKKAIKVVWRSHHSPLAKAPDIQVLATRVSTKGSCAEADTNPLGKDPSDVHVNTIGLYVLIDQSTQLVALEKVYDSSSTILIINMCNNIWLTIFMSNVSNRFMNDWSTSLGYGSLYGFLEPQTIHNAKDSC